MFLRVRSTVPRMRLWYFAVALQISSALLRSKELFVHAYRPIINQRPLVGSECYNRSSYHSAVCFSLLF